MLPFPSVRRRDPDGARDSTRRPGIGELRAAAREQVAHRARFRRVERPFAVAASSICSILACALPALCSERRAPFGSVGKASTTISGAAARRRARRTGYAQPQPHAERRAGRSRPVVGASSVTSTRKLCSMSCAGAPRCPIRTICRSPGGIVTSGGTASNCCVARAHRRRLNPAPTLARRSAPTLLRCPCSSSAAPSSERSPRGRCARGSRRATRRAQRSSRKKRGSGRCPSAQLAGQHSSEHDRDDDRVVVVAAGSSGRIGLQDSRRRPSRQPGVV